MVYSSKVVIPAAAGKPGYRHEYEFGKITGMLRVETKTRAEKP
jgi:hypothetical protein